MQYRSIIVLSVFLFSLTACKSGQRARIIQNLKLNTTEMNGDTFVNMDVDLKAGKLKLPINNQPVIDPVTGIKLGSVNVVPLDNGYNHVEIDVNATEASRLNSQTLEFGKTLPNGRPLPRRLNLNPATNITVGIPFLQNSRIYLGVDPSGTDLKEHIVMGLAVVLPVLDQTSVYVPIPLNLFLGFKLKNQMHAVTGLFTSPVPAHSGVAVFAEKINSQDPAFLPVLSQSDTTENNEIDSVDVFTMAKMGQIFRRSETVLVK